MPKKVCGLGFDCASMMQCVGIAPHDCLNFRTCGAAEELTEEEEFELVRVRAEARARWQEEEVRFRAVDLEQITLNRRQAARAVLVRRGCSQGVESVVGLIGQLRSLANELEALVGEDEQQFIAPVGAELHTYSVKRPSRPELLRQGVPEQEVRTHQKVFDYQKLLANEEIFEPVTGRRYNKITKRWEPCEKVRAIHLGKLGDPLYVEAGRGILRRNMFQHLETVLSNVVELLGRERTRYHEAIPPRLPHDGAWWLEDSE